TRTPTARTPTTRPRCSPCTRRSSASRSSGPRSETTTATARTPPPRPDRTIRSSPSPPPARGEAGGDPSGTEAYYSFDYGNVHFVCLDSYDLDRTPAGDMLTWLEAGLVGTTKDLCVGLWGLPS